MSITDATRLAVLIDSDNTTASVTTELLEEIAKYGTPTVKRAYGDWTTQNLVGWKDDLLRYAIQPVQQFAYTRGKNSTDSALIIDAMDLLYAGNVEGFVIVSSDSDFTRLATRLRESGMIVYGLGRRATPAPFVAACDRFIYLELLSRQPDEQARRTRQDEEPVPPRPKLERILSVAITSTSKDDGWSNLAEVGSYLVKSHAAFDPRDYGHAKLGELVRTAPYVDVKDEPGPTGSSRLWVRLTPTTSEVQRPHGKKSSQTT
jgi:NYN domain/OST-HTH/LOTUS domain